MENYEIIVERITPSTTTTRKQWLKMCKNGKINPHTGKFLSNPKNNVSDNNEDFLKECKLVNLYREMKTPILDQMIMYSQMKKDKM